MKARVAIVILTVVAAFCRAQVSNADRVTTPRQAVERALPLLQESARIWTREGRCFSCHHQGLGATAVAVARERAFHVDEAKLREEIGSIRMELAPSEVGVSPKVNADLLNVSLALVALASNGVQRDIATDRAVGRLLDAQHVQGHWTPYPLRPPIEGSMFSQTAWTIRALRLFVPPDNDADVEQQIARATDWLSRETPRETEDLAMQLLGFGWSGATPDQIGRATNQLLAQQRADGGWGQVASRPSDAYATGQALVALNQSARVPTASAPFKKGVGFLMKTQHADGSWLVETRRTWKRGLPYFESGFPHGKHQFVSYAGSAWATMALALSGRDDISPAIMGDPRKATSYRTVVPPATSVARSASASDLTPLMHAALSGSPEELRALLENHPDVNEVAGPLGVTALMCAARDPVKMALLISAGANVNATSKAGASTLLIATDSVSASGSVKLLLEHGADPNVRASARITPLAQAALRGDRAVAAMLLAAGARINDQPDGSFPLMVAVNQSDVAFVTFLLDRGANLESKVVASAGVTNGEAKPTPLMVAADRSDSDLVALLLKRGANVNARDLVGMTPLMYAAGTVDRGTTRVVGQLIAAGADLSARTPAGDTALDFATKYGKTDVVNLLQKAIEARRPF